MKKKREPEKENRIIIHTTTTAGNPGTRELKADVEKINETNRLISEHGDTVKQVHLHGKIGDVEYLDKEFHGTIKVFAKTKEEIITHSRKLLERRCYICPEFPVEKLEDITFITSMGIAVDLLYRVDRMEKDVLLKILDHYLHHSPLETPVEPFHFILKSKLKGIKVNIWRLHLLFPD